MSLYSGVPAEFERVGRFGAKIAAQHAASTIRREGFKARVIADKERRDYVLFRGPKRRRAPQKRWQT